MSSDTKDLSDKLESFVCPKKDSLYNGCSHFHEIESVKFYIERPERHST